MSWFDTYYQRAILFGLVSGVWFGVAAQAAHDVWSASVLFLWVTVLCVMFCVGRYRDRRPVRLPLWIPTLAVLLAFWASRAHSYDIDTTNFELWGWFFSVL